MPSVPIDSIRNDPKNFPPPNFRNRVPITADANERIAREDAKAMHEEYCATRQTEVESVMCEQSELLHVIEDGIGCLEARLYHVMRQESAAKACANECSRVLCDFATRLLGNNDRLMSLRGRITDILDRLEV